MQQGIEADLKDTDTSKPNSHHHMLCGEMPECQTDGDDAKNEAINDYPSIPKEEIPL